MPVTSPKIKEYLNRPYPYYYGSWDKLLLILTSVSVLSFSFSYFFEPFEVNRAEHKFDYFWICIVHAFVPLGIALVYFLILDILRTDEHRWTLGKETLHLSILLGLIGIGSFLVRDIIYDNPNNWSWRYFWEEIRNTFLVGSLLLAVLLPLNLERLLSKYTTAASRLNILDTGELPNKGTVPIETPINSEAFELDITNFLFAKVDGNYMEIYKQEGDAIQKILIRLPLKQLKTQLLAFPLIFQTHRSYLVNIHRITSVSGNAQGYLLSFEGCDVEVPVSRSRIAEFNAFFLKNA
ncbi:MAG: LytTR family DNA-binding domain-containing protein [Pricia sp.]